MTCHYIENKLKNDRWCEKLPTVRNDEDGKDYCVFHAPTGKKGVSLYEFNEQIFDLINIAKKENKPCNLFGVVFEGDIDFYRFNKDNPLPEINFMDVVFPGEVRFIGTYFKKGIILIKAAFHEDAFFNTVYEELVSFMGVTFQKDATFISAEFRGPTNFMGVKFSSGADFLSARFDRRPLFIGCVFEDSVRFQSSTFADNTLIQKSLFQQTANFRNCKFKGDVLFEENNFDKTAYFKESCFYSKASIINTTFKEKADFSDVLFSKNSLIKGATFHDIGILTNLSIHDKLILDGVSLKKTTLFDSDLRKIDFYNCEWYEQNGWKLLYDEVLAIAAKAQSTSSQLFGKVEILYRQLKQKCKEENNEIEASNWHYREKEIQRKGTGSLFIKIFLNIYYAASGYGENPRLAFLVLILLILLSTFLLSICGLMAVNSAGQSCNFSAVQWPQNADFQQMIFVLIDVFKYVTYQKDACLQPTSTIGQIVKTVSQILIPIQGALFAFALKNKFRR